MSHRRKKAVAKLEEIARLRSKEQKLTSRIVRAYDEHPKSVIASVVMVLLISFLAYQATTGTLFEFEYVQCFSNATVVQHTHFEILIQIGERFVGGSNLLFIRVPENMGLGFSCMYPMHTHGAVPGERDFYYTKVHVESPYSHSYTLGDFFEVWGKGLGYPGSVYFGSDGVSFYRSSNTELWLRYGPIIEPVNQTYSSSVLNRDYQNYVPKDGDTIEIIVHDPYTTLACPYFPYTDSAGPGCEP